MPKVPSGGRYCLGKALSCSELNAYFRHPTFFTVFSRLQPSLRRQEEEETEGREGVHRQNESKRKKKKAEMMTCAHDDKKR